MLRVLYSPRPTADEVCLEKLAKFLGLEVRALSEPPAEEAGRTPVHIAATCESLEAFQRHPSGRAWLYESLAADGSTFFLTGIAASDDCLQTISSVVPGIVEMMIPVATSGSAYKITRVPSTGMPQFSGLTFGPADHQADSVFSLRPEAYGVTELITIDGRPCYIRVERRCASYYLLACRRVLDIDAPARHTPAIDRFLNFVPFLAYLRLTFGALCWSNPAPAACFIIDDPLLRKRYGFLDLNRLESSMERLRCSANIAFIPWNCRRSDPGVAEKFKRSDRRLSVSVHGCDHTEGEFGVTDENWLRNQSRRALSRMDIHEGLTGIKHNRVMVFPQGVFSKVSLKALSDEGFVAAVNSTVYPVDATPDEVTFRDLMEMAVVRFGGTPLFLRHYPDRREKIALDLFLGHQVLLVEHHGFFKGGYEKAERCVAFINEIASDITWTDLDELCTSAYVIREVPSHGMHVRAFGSILRLRNSRDNRTRFRVSNVSAQRNLASVTWKDRVIGVERGAFGAQCDLVLDSGEEGILDFHHVLNGAPVDEQAPGLKDRFKVFTRRLLCEIRDNYLDRSVMLSEFAKRGKVLLPRL